MAKEPRGTWPLKYLDLDPDLTKSPGSGSGFSEYGSEKVLYIVVRRDVLYVRWRGREPRGTWSLKYLDPDQDSSKCLDPDSLKSENCNTALYNCEQRCELRVSGGEGESHVAPCH
jgi:hypothetical protein